MLYGVASDFHGNDVALEETVHAMEEEGIKTENIIILGDTIDYNAHSERCTRLVAESKVKVVAGNHCIRIAGEKGASLPSREHYVAFGMTGQWNSIAEVCKAYTVATISNESAQYLANLPLSLRFDHSVATHAGLTRGWNYFNRDHDEGFAELVKENMAILTELRKQPGNEGVNTFFFGHSHTAGYLKDGKFVPAFEGMTLDVGDRNQLYGVDAGSAGQPRDGDERSSWLRYDSDIGIITFKRTGYDIGRIAAANDAAGLPAFVSARLYQGK